MRSLVVLALVWSGTALAQTDGGAGVTKSTTSVSLADAPTDTYAVDVYRPAGTPPFPVVALGHGFQNSKDNQEALARELAARGLVVVVPQFPLTAFAYGWSDHARNGTILLAAVDQQVGLGVADGQRLGLGGHSAGGLAAWVAASSRSATKVVVLLDAVDVSAIGAGKETSISAPTLWTFTTPATCNSYGNSGDWYAGKAAAKARFRVVGSMHCDPQDPVSSVCSMSCGGYQAAKSAVFTRYAVDFFARGLLGKTTPCFADLVGADVDAGVLAEADVQLGACAAPVDAGTPVRDAGVDGGAAPREDAGGTGDGGASGQPDAGGGEPTVTVPSGCGCGAGGFSSAWSALLALALAAGYRRARHAVVRPG